MVRKLCLNKAVILKLELFTKLDKSLIAALWSNSTGYTPL